MSLSKEVLCNNQVSSIETGRMIISHLFPWSNLEKCIYTTLFLLMMIKFYRHYLIYKYNNIILIVCTFERRIT